MDRNFGEPMLNFSLPKSLSVRRAWIEIDEQIEQESTVEESLSVRRAWIEIHFGTPRR